MLHVKFRAKIQTSLKTDQILFRVINDRLKNASIAFGAYELTKMKR